MKNLQNRNEKETGIEFVIGDLNSYEDFIALLDAMSLAKQETYGVDFDETGHLFAVHIKKDPAKDQGGFERICGYYTEYITYNQIDGLHGLARFYYQVIHLPKQAYYVVFGYLILLEISVLSLIRRHA